MDEFYDAALDDDDDEKDGKVRITVAAYFFHRNTSFRSWSNDLFFYFVLMLDFSNV